MTLDHLSMHESEAAVQGPGLLYNCCCYHQQLSYWSQSGQAQERTRFITSKQWARGAFIFRGKRALAAAAGEQHVPTLVAAAVHAILQSSKPEVKNDSGQVHVQCTPTVCYSGYGTMHVSWTQPNGAGLWQPARAQHGRGGAHRAFWTDC